MAEKIKTKKAQPVKTVKCQQFGNRCSICGTFFEEDVCENGHQIGYSYTVATSTKR